MNWKIGDMAIMVNCRFVEHEGRECHITGLMRTGCDDGIYFRGYSIQCFTGNWCARPSQLRPIPENKHKRFHAQLIPAEPDYQWNKETVTCKIAQE